MTTLTYLTSFILLLIAVLHFLWGVDVYWPAKDEASLAKMVVGAKGITQMPNFWACSFVTVALLIGAVIVLRLAGVMDVKAFGLKALPLWLFQLAGLGFALVLLSRGIIGFTPFWAQITPEEPFRTWNKQFYSPLCIALGMLVNSIIVFSKFQN